MCFLVSIKKRFCTLRLLFFIFKHFVRFLFEGGFYFLFLNILCGFYSRAASIQENTVFIKDGCVSPAAISVASSTELSVLKILRKKFCIFLCFFILGL